MQIVIKNYHFCTLGKSAKCYMIIIFKYFKFVKNPIHPLKYQNFNSRNLVKQDPFTLCGIWGSPVRTKSKGAIITLVRITLELPGKQSCDLHTDKPVSLMCGPPPLE